MGIRRQSGVGTAQQRLMLVIPQGQVHRQVHRDHPVQQGGRVGEHLPGGEGQAHRQQEVRPVQRQSESLLAAQAPQHLPQPRHGEGPLLVHPGHDAEAALGQVSAVDHREPQQALPPGAAGVGEGGGVEVVRRAAQRGPRRGELRLLRPGQRPELPELPQVLRPIGLKRHGSSPPAPGSPPPPVSHWPTRR